MFVALLLACTAGPVSATKQVSLIVETAAIDMKCKDRSTVSLEGGGKNYGWKCKVKGHGRFYVLRYHDPELAETFWQESLNPDEDKCVLRRGSLFVVPIRYDRGPAEYAKTKVRGRLVCGVAS